MNKILILLVLLTSLGANALTEKEKAIAFMKDWVTFANGRVEAYQRNVVTGKTRLVSTDERGRWTVVDIKLKKGK